MTNSNVDVVFSKIQSSLSHYGSIIARGPKKGNLFTCSASQSSRTHLIPNYTMRWPVMLMSLLKSLFGITDLLTQIITLLIRCRQLNTTIGLTWTVHNSPIPQCVNCLHEKQTQAPFQKTENLPDNIRDIEVSDLCSPFETSIGGFKYFITWIDLKSRFANIEFLKNKECDTISESFKHYLAWLL